jgi:MoxR-like ATPase
METFENLPEPGFDTTLILESGQKIRDEISRVVVGQDDAIELLLIALFTGGHVLIEGVPGIAKTLTARLLAKTVSARFSRIQFTPDMMPADIIGTTVFNLNTSLFTFSQGPVFANLVLADEINRAPAKTQAALFEVMEERQITVDGHTYPMETPFMVIATQNPIEQEGTYKLPEAQLDRFLFRIKIAYPSLEEEVTILQRFQEDFDMRIVGQVNPVITPETIAQCRALIEKVLVKDELLQYIARLVHESRNIADLFLGASPRASIAVMKASKAIAAIRGRAFVTPDDIRFVIPHILNHRIILSPEREMEGAWPEDVIQEITNRVEVPR